MTLFDVLVCVIGLSGVIWFWRFRANAEAARSYAMQYCKTHDLIFVSIHRHKIFWVGKRAGQIEYLLSFTTDPELAYEGTITVKRQRVIQIDMPAFRIPE